MQFYGRFARLAGVRVSRKSKISLHFGENFVVLRESLEQLFRKNQLAVFHDFKYAAGTFDHGDICVWKLFFNVGLQTGGLRFVVSHHTVFN